MHFIDISYLMKSLKFLLTLFNKDKISSKNFLLSFNIKNKLSLLSLKSSLNNFKSLLSSSFFLLINLIILSSIFEQFLFFIQFINSINILLLGI